MPITEAPWERTRFQAYNVWRSNGTLDGTLSWYSTVEYLGRDPWTTQHWINCSAACTQDPAGFGYELWPPPPGRRNQPHWAPIETIVWTMLGAGLQDAEYLHALSQHQAVLGPDADAVMAQARAMATGFPAGWFGPSRNWGDDGYQVDVDVHADGSGVVNTWKLEMGRLLSQLTQVIP